MSGAPQCCSRQAPRTAPALARCCALSLLCDVCARRQARAAQERAAARRELQVWLRGGRASAATRQFGAT